MTGGRPQLFSVLGEANHCYSIALIMFSPRRSRKAVVGQQDEHLLTDTSYDVQKCAELHKHVTEVSSDDDSFSLSYASMTSQKYSPTSTVYATKQRFFRLDLKRQNRCHSLSNPTIMSVAGDSDLNQPKCQLAMSPVESGDSPMPHGVKEPVKESSFGTTVLVDDFTSNESTVQNSFSTAQSSSESMHDLEGNVDTLSPDPLNTVDENLFQGVESVVSVRVVDGFAQMVILSQDDFSSDDDNDDNHALERGVFPTVTSIFKPRNDLDRLLVSSTSHDRPPTDSATTASFEFSTVDWRAVRDTAGNANEDPHKSVFRDYRQQNTVTVRQKDAVASDNMNTLDRHALSSDNQADDDSFGLHAYSTDFDPLDASFADGTLAAIPSCVFSMDDSVFGEPEPSSFDSALGKSTTQNSLFEDSNKPRVSSLSEEFNLSFDFIAIDWVQPSSPSDTPAPSNSNNFVRRAPPRTGSQLSQESQQRIKDYLTKDTKGRLPSKTTRSVGYASKRAPRMRSNTSSATTNMLVLASAERITHPRCTSARDKTSHATERAPKAKSSRTRQYSPRIKVELLDQASVSKGSDQSESTMKACRTKPLTEPVYVDALEKFTKLHLSSNEHPIDERSLPCHNGESSAATRLVTSSVNRPGTSSKLNDSSIRERISTNAERNMSGRDFSESSHLVATLGRSIGTSNSEEKRSSRPRRRSSRRTVKNARARKASLHCNGSQPSGS